jgi:hypothetical protein
MPDHDLAVGSDRYGGASRFRQSVCHSVSPPVGRPLAPARESERDRQGAEEKKYSLPRHGFDWQTLSLAAGVFIGHHDRAIKSAGVLTDAQFHTGI